jgi:1A family penicillin-binding protein
MLEDLLKNKGWKIAFLTGKYLFLLFLVFCIFVLFLFFYYTYDLPRPEKFTERQFLQSTKIYDRTGEILLYNIHGEEKREIVSLSQIPADLKNAVISSEDDGFYQHKGLDFKSIIRAILIDLKLKAPSQGASTITQQLIRSTYLTRRKTLARKVREVVLTLELERRYSKNQILEWYLNQIPLGENIYGVQSASQTYFNKSVSEISLAEAATLAAVIPAPSYYSPFGPNKNKLLEKKNYVLERMEKLGYITKDQLEKAKQEKINFSEVREPIKAPHFVMYVKKYLEDKYGEDFLKEKGLKIYTTLDWDLQNFAEQAIKERDKINKQFNANNTALVVINPKTGEILSLIGSKNYFEKSYPNGCDEKPEKDCLFEPMFDVATMGARQPGSSFKPFVYATAFKKGYTPSTVLWDVKTEFNPNCSADANQERDQYGLDCYHPQNYDEKFRGKVSLRSALGQSLNLPSVKVLYLAGLKDSLQTAKDFGITTLNKPDRYGLSLVLGGGEVNLLEMTSAFGVFSQEGQKMPVVSILKIEDSDGNIIEENKKQPFKVLDTQIAREINDILSDNEARSPIFGENSMLYFKDFQVAAKTGTTQNYRDAWTIGYTPFVVIGVWVGNNNNSPIKKGTGIGLAAPIWRKVMEKLLQTHPVENFTKPDPITNIKPILMGQIESNDIHSILYYINKDDPLGPAPLNPNDDPQYFLWEEGIKNWLSTGI